ncbi:hypothetical protein QE177_04515 [Arsenophonus sp. aPb]|uniref:hypothetical protein n=1 Tax=Arsenophonus sp. aPb TaxID=3041619 RepID=UPI00246846FD|nr:hypothetical protein [Arsenophonus sp. aPb]WGL99149.1 hypothetical protein QE177_04515 [Arsenophonus sp. aPb]
MFKHELDQNVKITVSNENGRIKGRAEYANTANQYLIHYKVADGRAVDGWFYEDEISPLTPNQKM